jgi:hypothetical protein
MSNRLAAEAILAKMNRSPKVQRLATIVGRIDSAHAWLDHQLRPA